MYFCSGRAGGNEHLFRTCQVGCQIVCRAGTFRGLCAESFFFELARGSDSHPNASQNKQMSCMHIKVIRNRIIGTFNSIPTSPITTPLRMQTTEPIFHRRGMKNHKRAIGQVETRMNLNQAIQIVLAQSMWKWLDAGMNTGSETATGVDTYRSKQQ